MTKGLFALLLAGALMVPHITLGNDGTVGLGGPPQRQPQAGSWEALPLPSIPHLETMPWATSDFALRGPKIDFLLGPEPKTLGTVLVQPPAPPTQFFSNARPAESRLTTK